MVSSNNSTEVAQSILKKYVDEMPSFSPATAKIIQLANTMNAPANEIVAAIRLDPVLTGRVLQLVNSAYFSLAQKVTSLNRALVYLGINTIKNLALSTAVMQAFDTKNKALAEEIKPIWKNSLATAVCTKNIAKLAQVPQTQIEEYFIAGLLHKIGRIILVQAFFATKPYDSGISVQEERLRYGQDHAGVAADTLRRWKFSEDLIGGIENYLTPNKENPLSYFIHVAEAMTYRLKLNGSEENTTEVHPIARDSWEALKLTEKQVLSELATTAEQIEKAEIFLNIASSKEKVVEQP